MWQAVGWEGWTTAVYVRALPVSMAGAADDAAVQAVYVGRVLVLGDVDSPMHGLGSGGGVL